MRISDLTRREVATALFSGALLANPQTPSSPPKILLVVAHPDDEYYFAGTTFRLAQELGALVDHIVITNGEGGFRYSALAEKIYGCALSEEKAGRARLPLIRREETEQAGKILGIRQQLFLDQPDVRFTLDLREALDRSWDVGLISRRLREALERERYDFVFTLLPRASEHGHHQAAALLVASAVAELPETKRPAVLLAEPGRSGEAVAFQGSGITRSRSAEPALVFDRKASFADHRELTYNIVVHWVIAAHKSQGLFQGDWGKHDLERFWLLDIGPADVEQRTALLAAALTHKPLSQNKEKQ